MADIQITDQVGHAINDIKIDPAHPSSLLKYAQEQLLHLAVLPDFLKKKDQTLSAAATQPIQFQLSVEHEFTLGNIKPEVSIRPSAQVTLRANASPGTNLFEGDPFKRPAIVPASTGYVALAFEGALDLGVSGSEGDLTFGFEKNTTVGFEWAKAFPLGGAGESTLGHAVGTMLSSYVIPADVEDFKGLAVNDVATVSGKGSLKVSGAVKYGVAANPLASPDLPLGIGKVAVSAGASIGLSASMKIAGGYQVRVQRTSVDTVVLSVLKDARTDWDVTLSAKAGVSATVAGQELISKLLGAISTDPAGDKKMLEGLSEAEVGRLTDAIQGGLNHSLAASFNATLSGMNSEQIAFQYEIRPAELDAATHAAIHQMLDGDLGSLTEMEKDLDEGQLIGPGVKMLTSVLVRTRKNGASLKVNLLGIVNLLSVSELIRKSEILHDGGELTIKETITGNQISAILKPLDREAALRKVLFDSLRTTTTYRAANAVAMPDLESQQMHFGADSNANRPKMRDFLNWFVPLGLLTADERDQLLDEVQGGTVATCVMCTGYLNQDCLNMFLAGGQVRSEGEYREIGRQAMLDLLDPANQPVDVLRQQLLRDRWTEAMGLGPVAELGPLVGLSRTDVRVQYLVGDVYDIQRWAFGMVEAGQAVVDLRQYVGGRDLQTLLHDNGFKLRRERLQKTMASVVSRSKTRFDDPWGMVCLYQAAGRPRSASGKLISRWLTVEKDQGRGATA